MSGVVSGTSVERVVEADFAAAWWLLGEVTGAEMHRDRGLRWFWSGAAERTLNPVLETRLDGDGAGRRVDALVDELSRRGAPFIWWLHPTATPRDLADRLAARGLQAGGVWPAMTLATDALVAPPPVAGLAIRPVNSDADLEVYLDVFAPILSPSPAFTALFGEASRRIGYGEDAAEMHFVGWLGDEPVATVSLLTSGGAAGIYNVTTLERARGRGIAAAMTATAVQAGRKRGLRIASLQASELGRPVYERLGFRFVCDLVPYRYPEESS